MHSRYNRLRIKALSDRGKSMAAARWAKDRIERDAGQAERIAEMRAREIVNLPHNQGDVLGVLQWADFASGKVRRWTIRIGDRRDRITIDDKKQSHGWTWFVEKLRKHLSQNY